MSCHISKRERRELGRLKADQQEREALWPNRRDWAERDRRIVDALERVRQSNERTLAWIEGRSVILPVSVGMTSGDSGHRLSGEQRPFARAGHAAGSRSSDGPETGEE